MSMIDWFKKLLGGQRTNMLAASPTNANQPTTLPDGDEATFLQSCARRDTHWATVGTIERSVLAHAISPSLRCGPAWPTRRQAYRVIRRPGTILIATDGMSDPFKPPVAEGNGFGMELFIETADIAPEHAGA